MASRKVCSALNCQFSKAKNPRLSFHRFPVDPEVRLKWIASVCDKTFLVKDKQRSLSLSSYRICSNHFKEADFLICGKRKILHKSAIPCQKGTFQSAGRHLNAVHLTVPEDNHLESPNSMELVDHDYCELLEEYNRNKDVDGKYDSNSENVLQLVCNGNSYSTNKGPSEKVVECINEDSLQSRNVMELVEHDYCELLEKRNRNNAVDGKYDSNSRDMSHLVGNESSYSLNGGLPEEIVECSKEDRSNLKSLFTSANVNEKESSLPSLTTDFSERLRRLSAPAGYLEEHDDRPLIPCEMFFSDESSDNENYICAKKIKRNTRKQRPADGKHDSDSGDTVHLLDNDKTQSHMKVMSTESVECCNEDRSKFQLFYTSPDVNGNEVSLPLLCADVFEGLPRLSAPEENLEEDDDFPIIATGRFLSVKSSDSTRNVMAQKMKKKKVKKKAVILKNCDVGKRKRMFITKKKIILKEFGYRDNDITPRKQKMFQLLRDLKGAVVRVKNAKNEIVQDMKKFVINPINSALRENISPLMLQLVTGELRNKNKKPRARRWTMEDKTIAAAFYKRAPRHYNFLRKLICLPSKRSVLNHINRVPFEPGVNVKIFEHLAVKAKSMKEQDTTCTLLFDEMSIKPSLWYDPRKDRIEGYEDYGSLGRGRKVADHALVFMVKGLRSTWKMPIAYYLTAGSVPGAVLCQLIKVMITELSNTGLRVKATVCDQGPTNRTALTMLTEETEEKTGRSGPYFEVNGMRIYTIFDPPHLLKSIRNNFMKYDVYLKGKQMVAKWEHIRQFYNLDKGIANMALKLRKEHINPVGRAKMRVKLAAQVLSHTVSAGIRTYVACKKMASEAMYTANFITLFDRLFDTFNGDSRYPLDGKEYRTCLHTTSKHWALWEEMLEFINPAKDNMIFFNQQKKQRVKPPSQKGWVTSINAVKSLFWDLHKNEGLIYLNMKNVNQDALENLFSIIRQHGAFNTNPTAFQFAAALKTSIISSMSSKSSSSNCEEDNIDFLTDLNNFFCDVVSTNIGKNCDSESSDKPEQCSNGKPKNIYHQVDKCENKLVDHYSSQRQSYAYISGYIIKRSFRDKSVKNCPACVKGLTTKQFSVDHVFITEKEYREYSNCLHYPHRQLTNAVIDCVKILYMGQPISTLDQVFHQPNIIETMTKDMSQLVDWKWMQCSAHKEVITGNVAVSVCRIFLKSWCKKFAAALKELQEEKRRKSLQNKAEKIAQKKIAEMKTLEEMEAMAESHQQTNDVEMPMAKEEGVAKQEELLIPSSFNKKMVTENKTKQSRNGIAVENRTADGKKSTGVEKATKATTAGKTKSCKITVETTTAGKAKAGNRTLETIAARKRKAPNKTLKTIAVGRKAITNPTPEVIPLGTSMAQKTGTCKTITVQKITTQNKPIGRCEAVGHQPMEIVMSDGNDIPQIRWNPVSGKFDQVP